MNLGKLFVSIMLDSRCSFFPHPIKPYEYLVGTHHIIRHGWARKMFDEAKYSLLRSLLLEVAVNRTSDRVLLVDIKYSTFFELEKLWVALEQ